jgi:hypothetical protein
MSERSEVFSIELKSCLQKLLRNVMSSGRPSCGEQFSLLDIFVG